MRRNTHDPGACKACVWLLFGLLASPATFAADSYLQQLEAEAAATDNTPQPVSPPAQRPNWSQQQATAGEKLDSGLSMRQFEESLKHHFYGSYLFYSALNNKKQKVVYQEYQKNGDIEHLRNVIKTQMTN
jgi:hypothetical protein